MTEYFRDFYGCTASITKTKNGKYRLKERIPQGKLIRNTLHTSYNAARQTMYRDGGGWKKLIKKFRKI